MPLSEELHAMSKATNPDFMSFKKMVAACEGKVTELFPWDLSEQIESNTSPLLLDIREPYEFDAMHIRNSINVPRGILEAACEYDYEETVPELVNARQRDVVVICRSGNRSLLAGAVMQQLGYESVSSLKTGLRGWNDFEQELVDKNDQPVSIDDADDYFTPKLRPDQKHPG